MTFTIDGWQVLDVCLSTLLPVLVGLVTTRVTRPGVQSALLAALSSGAGFGTEVLAAHTAHAPYDVSMGAVMTVVGFTVAVATHEGLLKPTGLAAVLNGLGMRPAGQAGTPVTAVSTPNAPAQPISVGEILAGRHAAADTASFTLPDLAPQNDSGTPAPAADASTAAAVPSSDPSSVPPPSAG